MRKIAVVGSVNTDFVFTSKHLPKPSETISGESFAIYYGGKGANVAVAISRQQEKVSLFGAVGDDIHSSQNLLNLKQQKVGISNVEIIKGQMGGSACITMGDDTNSIVVVPGANAKYGHKSIKKALAKICECDVIATQLEIDYDGVVYLIDEAYKAGKKVIFNPSPIRDLPQELLDKCAYIIVNEVEIKQLPSYVSEEQMLCKYNGRLILTKGGEGAFYYHNGKVNNVPSIVTKVVNTTGAGDTFLGSFAVSILNGKDLPEAVAYANVCAGLKVGKAGTQTGMPTKAEIEQYYMNK